MNLRFWLRHPRMAWARVRYWLWERRNPDKPWLTPGAVEFLDRHLTREMAGLEFGSGRSTAWFARKLGRVASVEHDAAWYSRVKADLTEQNLGNVDYRHVPLDHPEAEGERAVYDPLPAYVAVVGEFPDETFDLVVIDGHYRSHCLAAAVPKLKPGGLLLVDDANMWPGNRPPVPEDWPEVSRTTNGIKFTVLWRKPG